MKEIKTSNICDYSTILSPCVWENNWLINKNYWDELDVIGCNGRFGRGASLYRFRSQVFVRLWARFPLPTELVSEI